jgi:hypothetical protein
MSEVSVELEYPVVPRGVNVQLHSNTNELKRDLIAVLSSMHGLPALPDAPATTAPHTTERL